MAQADQTAAFLRAFGHGRVQKPGRWTPDEPARDWTAEAERFREAFSPKVRDALASDLGVSGAALDMLSIGWSGRAWTIPERDGSERIVGISTRAPDGSKRCEAGSRRGLTVPSTLDDLPDPVLVVEGMSDVAACVMLGLAAVGRPSCDQGGAKLAELLSARDFIVVGERDERPDGSWPGRDDADTDDERVRTLLAEALHEDIASALAAETETAEERVAVAERIVRLATEQYRLGVSTEGMPFAVEREGPNLALSLRGSSEALRARLAREYRRSYSATPSGSALADAMTVLTGEAQDAPAEPVHLRLGRHSADVIIDMGDAAGRVIVVTRDGWRVADRSPVLFRRTALTGEIPTPVCDGDIEELWNVCAIAGPDRPLVIGWLVHALLPNEPHAILLLGGPQGSGKTTTAERLSMLVDPSGAPTRAEPRDTRQWAITASGSWVVAIDNLSAVTPWFSDALCRAATGDGWVDRALYTDSELAVLRFQRAIILTSIDAGALRGDLADRLVLADLERIRPERRRAKRELDENYEVARPRLLGALLDLLVRALADLPTVDTDTLPRMADFARVLAALDKVRGTDGLSLYIEQSGRVAQDVVDADAVAVAVMAFASEHGEWVGMGRCCHLRAPARGGNVEHVNSADRRRAPK